MIRRSCRCRRFQVAIKEYGKAPADRVLTDLEGKNWKIQLDNELPITLVSDTNYFIKKETYHRLLKGTGNLILKIKEI